jgi:hypothetical protein
MAKLEKNQVRKDQINIRTCAALITNLYVVLAIFCPILKFKTGPEFRIFVIHV